MAAPAAEQGVEGLCVCADATDSIHMFGKRRELPLKFSCHERDGSTSSTGNPTSGSLDTGAGSTIAKSSWSTPCSILRSSFVIRLCCL